MRTYFYSVDDEDFENAYTFECRWDDIDIEWTQGLVAEDAAEDFWNEHDGVERSWPLSFYIFDETGKLLGSKRIKLESCPLFTAYDIK